MIPYIIIYSICGIYLILNFKFQIQMFQQNSYRIPRYWRWLKGNLGSAWSLVDIACLFLIFSTLLTAPLSAIAVAIVAIVKIAIILRKKYKKPLVFTKRVWRLYSLTTLLALGGYIAMILISAHKDGSWDGYAPSTIVLGFMLCLSVCSFAPLIIADIILMPVENGKPDMGRPRP